MGEVAAQSRLPREETNWLQVVARLNDGARDQVQVIFFEVPDTVTSTLYFAVRDAGNDGTSPDQEMGGTPSRTDYYLLGGPGTLSNPISRQDFYTAAQLGADTHIGPATGTILSQLRWDGTANNTTGDFVAPIDPDGDNDGADHSGWVYFPGVSPAAGERIGNRYYFRVVIEHEATGDVDKNAFQMSVSLSPTAGTPTEPAEVRAFAYSWNAGLLQSTNTWDMYPFVPDTATGSIVYWNFDMDNGERVDAFRIDDSYPPIDNQGGTGATVAGDNVRRSGAGGTDPTNDGAWTEFTLETPPVSGVTVNGTWRLRITETNGAEPDENTAEFWFTDSTTQGGGSPFRAYADFFLPALPVSVAVSAADGVATADGTETEQITFQIVDAGGDPVPYSRDIFVSLAESGVTPSTVDIVETNGDPVGSYGQSRLITTGVDGIGFIRITNTEAETVTVSVETDGAGAGTSTGDDRLPAVGTLGVNETNIVLFSAAADAPPTMDSGGVTVVNENATADIGAGGIVITEDGTPNITAVDDIYIRIPPTIGAVFNTAVTNPGLSVTGTGTVAPTVTYPDARTMRIDVTADFAGGDLITVGTTTLPQVTGVTASPASSLQLSFNGATGPYSVTDPQTITVNGLTTYVWQGGDVGNETNWGTAANWNPAAIPDGANVNVEVPSAGVTHFPVLDMARSVFNISVASGASLDLNGRTLTVGGALSNEGRLILDGVAAEGAGIAAFDVDSGTIEYSGAGADLSVVGTTYHGLEISGSATLPSNIDVNDDLTVSGTLNGSTHTITVAGDWTRTGTFNGGTGTVAFDGGGTTIVSGATTFTNLTVDTPGKVVRFTIGETTVVTGALTVAGVSGGNVQLRPTAAGTWTINATGSASIQFATVEESVATVGLTAFSSTNVGTTTNWTFSGQTYTWAGVNQNTSEAANWSPNGNPGANDSIVIPNVTPAPVADAALDVRNVTVESGASLDINGSAVTVSDTLTNLGTLRAEGGETVSVGTFDAAAGATIYDGGATYAGGLPFGDAYFDLEFDGAGSWTASTGLTVNNDLSVTAGTLTGGAGAIDIEGSVTGAGTFTASSTNTSIGGNFTVAGFSANGGTIVFDTAGPSSVGAAAVYNFNNVIISADTTLAGNWSAANVAIGIGFTLDTNGFDLSSSALGVSGTLTGGGGTIDINGTATVAAGGTFTGGAGAITVSGGMPVAGTFTGGAGTIDIDGNVTGAGSFTESSSATAVGGDLTVTTFNRNGTTSTITFDTGVASSSVGVGGGYDFNNVVVDANTDLAGPWTIHGTLTVSGATLDVSASNHALAAAGNVDLSTGTFTARNGTVTFNGAASPQTVATGGGSFYNLVIDKSAEANQVTALSTWTVTNGLTLTSGTWNAGAFTHSIAGDWDSSATAFDWDQTGSTIRLTSASTNITVENATDTFNALTVTNGATVNSPLTAVATDANGALTQTLGAGSGPLDFGALTLSGATTINSNGNTIAATTVTGGGNNLTIAAGTDAGTTTVAGAVTNLGSGTGAALTVEVGVTGLVRFQNTVGGNSGFVHGEAAGSVRFDDDVTLGNGDTATSLAGTAVLDGLSWSGHDGFSVGGDMTISTAAVSIDTNGGAIALAAIPNGNSRDLTLDAGAGAVTLGGAIGGSTPIGSFTVTGTGAGLALPAVTLAPGSDATITVGGDLTQSAALVVPGQLSTDAGTGAVILTDGSNDFATLVVPRAGNGVSITDTNAIILGEVGNVASIGGTVVITAGDTVTIASGVQLNASGQTVTLNSTGGKILQTDAPDGTAEIVGAAVDLTSTVGGLGAGADPIIEVTSTALSADTTADNGAIRINVIGSTALNTVDAGTGDVTITATGAIDGTTDDNVAEVSGNVVSLTANGGGIGAGTPLDIDSNTNTSGSLRAVATGGAVRIDEVTGDMTIDLVTAVGNDVTLNSAGAINVAANDGTADIVGAAVALNAAAGGIGGGVVPEITATGSVSADTTTDGGNIAVETIGDLAIGLITTGVSAGRSVTITGTGAVNDAVADAVADIVTETLSVSGALTGFGDTLAIETQATAVSIAVASGTINAANSAAAAVTVGGLTTVDGSAPAVSFTQSGGGALTISGTVSTGDAGTQGGGVSITSTAALNVNAAVDTSGNLATGGTLTLEGAAVTVAPVLGGGNIVLQGAGADATFGVNVIVPSSITVRATGDIIVSNTIQAGGDVTLIADNDLDGIGGVQVQTGGAVVAAGNVSVEGSDLTVLVGAQHVEVQADGATNQIEAGGSVTIQPRGAVVAVTSQQTLNGRIQAVAGVTIVANGDVVFGAAGDIVPSTAGDANAIDVTADNRVGNNGHAITLNDATSLDAGSGTIALSADGDITLGTITTTNTTGAAVAITSTSGGVIDGGDAAVEIVADGAGATTTINTATGIGDAAGAGGDPAIETTVDVLSITNTTSGALRISETSALSIAQIVNTTAGSIRVVASDSITVNAGGGVTTGGADTVELDANGVAAVLTINAPVQSGGNVTVSAAGGVDINASVTTSGVAGFQSSGTTFDNTGGTIDTTGGSGGVQINHSGAVTIGASVDSGGAVSVGGTTITIAANISADNQPVTLADPVVLTNDSAIDTGSGAGDITFNATVDADAADTRVLSLNAGMGSVVIDGVFGTVPLNHVRILSATALRGAVNPIDMRGVDVYVDAPSSTIQLLNDVSVGNLYFYQGTLRVEDGTAGRTLHVEGDLAVFGPAYDPHDPERTDAVLGGWDAVGGIYVSGDGSGGGQNGFFAFPDDGDLVYFPDDGTYGAGDPGEFSVLPNASFAAFDDLAPTVARAATIVVGRNLYLNGATLSGTAPWTLTVPAGAGTQPTVGAIGSGRFGTPYAVAINGDLENADAAAGGWINAAENSVDNGGNNNVQFARPAIQAASIVNDRFVRVAFTHAVENSADEITSALASELVAYTHTPNPAFPGGGTGPLPGALRFDAAFIAPTHVLGEPLDETTLVPILGQGDQSVIYLRIVDEGTPTARWKTDAVGSGALGALNGGSGAATSTERSGVDSVVTVPDLFFVKGVFFAAEGATLAPNYGFNGVTRYDATTDRAGAVLHTIEYGRAAHRRPADRLYDGHNFLHLYWSEPVTIGSLPPTAENAPSQTTFASAAEYGGDIIDGGVAGPSSRWIDIVGYFRYQAPDSGVAMTRGSRPGASVADGEAHALYRVDTVDNDVFSTAPLTPPTAVSAAQQLRIYLSGYNQGAAAAELFPGWHANVPDVRGQTGIDVVANPFITDGAGNAVDHFVDTPTAGVVPRSDAAVPDPTDAVPRFLDRWDVSPPTFSTFDVSLNSTEIITRVNRATDFTQYLEMHILDNAWLDLSLIPPGSEGSPQSTLNPNRPYPPVGPNVQGYWDARQVEGGPTILTHPNRRENEGIRDTSFGAFGTLNPVDAFSVEEVDMTPLLNNDNVPGGGLITGIETVVEDPALFGDPPTVPANDSYIRIELDSTGTRHPWGLLTTLHVAYDATRARITDLAGNLLPSTTVPLRTIERTPPEIELALAIAGTNRVYIKFNEPVFGNDERSEAIGFDDFTVDGNQPTAIEILTTDDRGFPVDGARDAFLTLTNDIAADDFFSLTIRATDSDRIFDAETNAMPETDRRRLSDVAIGVVQPVWATDSFGLAHAGEGGFRTIRTFDGSEVLSRTDITLQSRLLTTVGSPGVSLVYDIDVEESERVGSYWSPTPLPGLIGSDRLAPARTVLPFETDGSLSTFVIPGGDAEMSSGERVEFQFRVGPLAAATAEDMGDPRTVAPWSIGLGVGLIAQRSNVTILNNVIYPERGESTVLVYELERPGMVTINVFSLDGSIVRTLQRGRQGQGTYRYAWDGRNNSGRVVARGIYFIRVVAPGVDEYRKVIVAR